MNRPPSDRRRRADTGTLSVALKLAPYYLLPNFVVFLGLSLGTDLVVASDVRGHVFDDGAGVLANWDGQWYKKIVADGYTYDPGAHSSVAFFPAYPLLGGLVSGLTGLGHVTSLLVVSNASFFVASLGLYYYVKVRASSLDSPPLLADYSLLAMGLIPTSFFFRMAYSESLFLLVTIAFFTAIERRWPLVVIAALVGLATACRPVGVCLIPPFLLCAWRRSPPGWIRLRNLVLLLPLACLGIAEYMLYLQLKFGEPLAFAKTQIHWAERPPVPLGEKVVALASFEPIRRLFDPSVYAYWGNYEPSVPPLLSLHVANSFLFLGALTLVALGASKRWLSSHESVASVLLLLIPYCTWGYETYMRSMGRYASAAVPIYLVLGHLLCRVPGPVAAGLLSVCGFLLGTYAALFASWHKFM